MPAPMRSSVWRAAGACVPQAFGEVEAVRTPKRVELLDGLGEVGGAEKDLARWDNKRRLGTHVVGHSRGPSRSPGRSAMRSSPHLAAVSPDEGTDPRRRRR